MAGFAGADFGVEEVRFLAMAVSGKGERNGRMNSGRYAKRM